MFTKLIRRLLIDDDPHPEAFGPADLYDRGITEVAGATNDGFDEERARSLAALRAGDPGTLHYMYVDSPAPVVRVPGVAR